MIRKMAARNVTKNASITVMIMIYRVGPMRAFFQIRITLLLEFLAYNITRKNTILYILSTMQSAKITQKGFKPGIHQYTMTARLTNTTVVGQETTIKGMVGMTNLKMLARKPAMPAQVRNVT